MEAWNLLLLTRCHLFPDSRCISMARDTVDVAVFYLLMQIIILCSNRIVKSTLSRPTKTDHFLSCLTTPLGRQALIKLCLVMSPSANLSILVSLFVRVCCV